METKTKAILGIAFGVLGLIIMPIIFGPLAIYFGHKARRDGLERKGQIAIVLGLIALVMLAFLFLANNYIFSL